MWVVSIYMYITFRSIGRSTNYMPQSMNMICHFNYMSLLSFKSIVWFSVYKSFTFKGAICAALHGSPRVRDWNDGLMRRVNIPSLPSVPTLWLLAVQELWAMPFPSAYKWAPYLECCLNLSVHLTIGMSTGTLPMPALGSRAPGVPRCDWSYQAMKSSGTNRHQSRQLIAFSYL